MATVATLLKQARQNLNIIINKTAPPPVIEIPRLYDFVRDAWPVLEPTTEFTPGWHIQAICEHLEAVTRGNITRLLINMPPRHAKSTIISVLWPIWTWLFAPSTRWLCASYALSLSIRDNRRCRVLIQSKWFLDRGYDKLFQLAGDQNVKSRFENNHRGYRMATSVASANTGEGGDILLIDDPHPADDATSDANREAAIRWFDETWSSRLNNQVTGKMVVVGQRIHQQDVSGHILEIGGWEHLNLCAEYEPAAPCVTSIWADPREEEGELLWPARFPRRVLERLKVQLGAQAYAAQFQQTPVPAGGGQYRQEWFQYFKVDENTNSYILFGKQQTKSFFIGDCRMIGTADVAVSLKQSADYTVFAIWAITPDRDLLLLEIVRARLSNPEQIQVLKSLQRRWRMQYWVIEAVAYQLAFIQEAIRQGIPAKEYRPHKDKVARAATGAVWYQNGKIYHLDHAHWQTDFEKELLLFPRAAHDDQADQIPMAVEDVQLANTIGAIDDDLAEEILNYTGY